VKSSILTEIVNEQPLRNLVEQANRVLEEELGHSLGSLNAMWKIKSGTVVLDLSYFEDSISATFTPAELVDKRAVQDRIHRLWVDLLLRNSRRTTEQLIQLMKEWKEAVPVEGN
jgi:hypothetical protein